MRISTCLLLVAVLAGPATALAQDGEKGPFGGFKHDRDAPIEIKSDALEVRQEEQVAIFTGNVVAGQGTLRLTADRMDVKFDQEAEGGDDGAGAIQNVKANGNVFLSNGSETAQGEQAEYDLTTGMVRMTGNVVLTQGEKNVLSGKTLVIDLNRGVARMEGRPTVIFTPARARE